MTPSFSLFYYFERNVSSFIISYQIVAFITYLFMPNDDTSVEEEITSLEKEIDNLETSLSKRIIKKEDINKEIEKLKPIIT